MNAPCVSVVIAAFNAEAYLSDTIDSVLAQTYRDFEVIVVDDGSTDRTAEIAEGYGFVRVVRQRNLGQPAARNVGIAASRGIYLAFVDADDLWQPNKLLRQMSRLAQCPDADWVYSDAEVFDSTTREIICRIGARLRLREGDILKPLLLESFVPSATPLVKKTALIEAGCFDESSEMRIGEDWNMWLRLAERHRAGLVDEPLAMIRRHSGSMSRTADPLDAFLSKRRIVEEAIGRSPKRLEPLRHRAISNITLTAAMRYLRLGDLRRARFYARRAIAWNPLNITACGVFLSAWVAGLNSHFPFNPARHLTRKAAL